MRRILRHKYVTSSLVLSFIHTCMKSLGEHGSIKQSWFGPANPWHEFPVSSVHESIKTARLSIRQDLQDSCVTNLHEDMKSFFFIASLLDPHTKSLSFCDDKHFPIGDSTCMDVDVDSVETELNVYTRMQQVPLDTDPLMWWNQHVQEFPRLVRMVRQHLAVSATSVSPERLFNSVGLVKSDLWGSLLDTTLMDVMWAKQAP